jgi:hypothetical protein
MSAVTITWVPVERELPDAEANVLLWSCGDAGNDAGAFEGFLDGEDDAGAPVFRDVTAMPVAGVTHWAAMPEGPTA